MRLGFAVYYALTADDVAAINANRATYATSDAPSGIQVHRGNPVSEGQYFPLLVTAVDEEKRTLNGQVFLDGNDTHWVQNVSEGGEPGQFDTALPETTHAAATPSTPPDGEPEEEEEDEDEGQPGDKPTDPAPTEQASTVGV